MFIKQNFEFKAICASKHTNSNANLLSRALNAVITALNEQVLIPDYVLFVLDAHFVDELHYTGYGVSTILGSWMEWLFKEISECFKMRISQLPQKALRPNTPQIYWIAAPLHINWDDTEYQMRVKFNNCMESVAAIYGNQVRIIKLKEHWKTDNSNLVVNNKFTASGPACYWLSIDAAFKFNYTKKLDF